MIVHFILSGETLESISEEINLENPKYLKEFHNKHCAREDFIHDDLIPRKKLLIPDINKIKEYNSRNDAPFKNPKLNPDIPFHPENFSKIYSVVNKEIYENQLEKKHTILTYTVSVKWMRNENGFHIFHLFKNNFSDGQGNMMVDLASESIRSLNPLEVKTDLKGNVVSISLTQQTTDNFAKIKKRLADLFPDQYANIYLNEFERAVQNRDLFNSRMKNDVFIKNYFAALRQPFENGKSFLQQTIGEENMTIQLQQKIENAEYNEEIIILQAGSMPENDLDFSGKYSLYTKSGLVKSVDISYAISQFGVKNSSFFTVTEMS
ncbi:hypothetical protein SAMN05421856_103490 [Chryseobacterium taichungense]|uniref:LysM domain-containing protein n=1 Tax=Chryseobacterium taichungense TaxID=295069 RepID=A0A1H7YU19_9FLAO|nr:hypothetical protein [Chryseobacterium taichungense]SEM48659.1 hypothetical protein SAMN05421856_103490 [Chryseobacterium taichungense]